MARKRKHPLVPLVLWLGLSLLACLMALVYVLGQLPATQQLEATHTAGMKHGYELCMAWEETNQEAKPVPLHKGSL